MTDKQPDVEAGNEKRGVTAAARRPARGLMTLAQAAGRRSARAVTLAGEIVRAFYQRRVAWLALLVSAAFLTYGGGAVMFWLHAIVRGEAGPAIHHVHHWLLDSTLGFIALTPVLGVIVPLAAWCASREGRSVDSGYILASATLFTMVTGPGPLLHNIVAGAGTPLADLATRFFGEDTAAVARSMHAPSHSALSEGLLQICVGFPVYLLCTWLALRFVRFCVRATRSRAAETTVEVTLPRADRS